MTNDRGPLDSRIEIVTPENIAFQYEVAGPFRRFPAYLIDLFIRVLLVVTFAWVAMLAFGFVGLGSMGAGLALVFWFLMAWFYGGWFETFFNGQTPGKRMTGLRVLSINGQPINALQAVMRNILRSVDAMPLTFYQVGLIASMVNDRYQRLGDVACGTMVVVEDRRELGGLTRIDDREVLDLAAALPADLVVSRSLGRALAHYVQRRHHFTPGRRAEIAQHVARPLLARLGLPADTNHDLLLCAVYHRAFIRDLGTEAP